MLRAGHAGPVRQQRAVRGDPGRDATGLREDSHGAGPVLQQEVDGGRTAAHADAAVQDRPPGRVRGRRGRVDGRPVVRVQDATAGVRQEARESGPEEEETDTVIAVDRRRCARVAYCTAWSRVAP